MFQQKAGVPRGGGKTGLVPSIEPSGTQRHRNKYVRHEIVSGVVTDLRSGSSRGVVIVGEHGAGKSFIAQRALEQLGEDYIVVQVRGSSISSTLPYGALSILLNELEAAHVEHPLMAMRGLTQLLHRRAQGRCVILFVDNAHELDDLSAMMIAQLTAGEHVRLLAACEDLPNVGGDIMGLWKDDMLRRVDLGTFDFDETAATLSLEFGGNFSHKAARALWSASGGNALFLLTLAREQIRLGVLVRQEGVWLLGHRAIALTGEIKDIVKARMNRLPPGQRDVFEMLALAGSIPLQTLMSVSQPQDMDALQESSIIEVSHEHPPMVSIANTVTANIVANVVPPGRSVELRRRLSAVLAGPEHLDSPGVNEVAWALDCGESVTADVALAAARAANRASDPAAALRFIREISEPYAYSGAAVESIWAHLSVNNHESVREILREFDHTTSPDLPLAEWTALQLAGAELDRRSPATTANAKLRLMEINTRIAEQAGNNAPGLDAVRARLRLAEAELAGFEGRYQDVLTLLEDLDIVHLRREPRILAVSLLCTALAVLGDADRAVALGDEIELAALSKDLSDSALRRLRGCFLQLLLLTGEFEKSEAYLAGVSTSSEPHPRLGGMFEIVQGVIDVHRGRVEAALPRLEAGARQLRIHDPDALAGLATATCAYAAGLHGDEEKANLFLAEIGKLPTHASWLTLRLTRYFELCARVELGQRTEATKALLTEADNDEQSSAIAPALHFLSAAARYGDSQLAIELRDLSCQASGPFAKLCSHLAEGLKQSDSELLLAVSQEAAGAGNAIFARDAARKAVRCASDAGNRISLRVAQRTQQSLEEMFSGSTKDINSLTNSILTAREREVAKAAAAGTSNRRIAEQMHVSVRTVEGHLYQVYAKLHVTSRAELKDVINVPSGNVILASEQSRRRWS